MDRLVQTQMLLFKLNLMLEEATDISGIHGTLRRLKKNASPTKKIFLRVKDKHGSVASSTINEKLVFRDHFSSQLGGSSSSFADLLSADCMSLSSWSTPKCSPTALVECIPGLP